MQTTWRAFNPRAITLMTSALTSVLGVGEADTAAAKRTVVRRVVKCIVLFCEALLEVVVL